MPVACSKCGTVILLSESVICAECGTVYCKNCAKDLNLFVSEDGSYSVDHCSNCGIAA